MLVWPAAPCARSVSISITRTSRCVDCWMGNISWRSQASSEDTDSSLQGDLDEDTGKDTTLSLVRACWSVRSMLRLRHWWNKNFGCPLEKLDTDICFNRQARLKMWKVFSWLQTLSPVCPPPWFLLNKCIHGVAFCDNSLSEAAVASLGVFM